MQKMEQEWILKTKNCFENVLFWISEELLKLIARKFEEQKFHSSFIDNIWGANLADIQAIKKI